MTTSEKRSGTLPGENFGGFTPETFAFLSDLGRHRSNRSWFESNRDRYERYLLEPMKALVRDLGPMMQLIDSALEVRPQVNMTVSRIFRDTRFSNDKSLFRNRMWLSFKDRSLPEGKRASFYFAVRPGSYSYGMGFYQADPDVMADLRKRIRLKAARFREIVGDKHLIDRFKLGIESYKRPPEPDYPADLADWFTARNFYYYRDGDDVGRLTSPQFAGELVEGFSILAPLYSFVMDRPTFVRFRSHGE